jgi:hypothetical protein
MSTTPHEDGALLAAELLARRWLPRSHPRMKKALVDAELWQDLERRLADVGLKLVDNVYADHVSVALLRGAERAVFGEQGLNASNNLELPRDGVALLVVLWSLIVLPKRERQAARAAADEGDSQGEMFAAAKPLPSARSASPAVSYRALLADFGNQLGKKTRLDANLKLLERHGFIERRADEIAEGPLLDLLLDYDALAPRILEGALADVLARERAAATAAPAQAADGTAGPDAAPNGLAPAPDAPVPHTLAAPARDTEA